MKLKKQNTRIKYGVLFFSLLIIEVLIACCIHDDFVRPYIGDMLVVIVIYCFVRIWMPESCRLLPLYIFLFAAAVEGLQYFDIVGVLGLEENAFMSVLIGSVPDWKDILCYGIGCAMLGGCERLKLKKEKNKTPDD